jgi:hypothetical protein
MSKIKITTDKQKVINAIAGIINSAFETGINPAWFEVESLNKGGFLDAAFASHDMATPSGKPAGSWTLRARLNGDQVDEDEDADSPWVTLTPDIVLERWYSFMNTSDDHSAGGRRVVQSYLNYLEAIDKGDPELAEAIFDEHQFDGVSDDGMAQIAIGEDWIFG